MFRARELQRNLFSARNQYLDLIDPDSFYALLAKHGEQLFWDYQFEDMYFEDNGRPCVPPSAMFNLMMLQMFDNCSDRQAIERSRFDIRWLAVLDLQIGERLCGRTTLQEFRARVHLNEKTEEQFKSILELAKRLGILKGPHLKVALDTTPILGRGAVKDTYNLIADGIRKLVGVLASLDRISAEQWAKSHDLARYWAGSSLKGEAKIDWSNDAERRVFLNGLVADADRLLMKAKKQAERASTEETGKIEEASALLRRLISQDTERVPAPVVGKNSPASSSGPADQGGTECSPPPTAPPTPGGGETENPCDEETKTDDGIQVHPEASPPDAEEAVTDANPPGSDAGVNVAEESCKEVADKPASESSHLLGDMLQIRQGVASDRVISVQDPEMRHGRKSASNRFDGHKQSVVVDTASKLILAVEILPGNAPDNQRALELTQQAASNAGIPVEKAVTDCAYGDGATRQDFHKAGIDLVAKTPSPPANDPFAKGRFILDLTNMIATCPAGKTSGGSDFSRHRRGLTERLQFPAETCQACPHKDDCLRKADKERSRGRTIELHPQEELLQKARQYQATPAFREDVKARQVVEHRQARMIQLGARQARYIGTGKTKFQSLMIAMVANLTLMARAIYLPTLVALSDEAFPPSGETGQSLSASAFTTQVGLFWS